MVISGNTLTIEDAAAGFAAIGSPARLEALRTLVKAGDTGRTVGEIQDRTAIPASTLAHHLRFLTSTGLIRQEKAGRTVINRAAFDHLQKLADYILKECCADDTVQKRRAS